ncbi:protein kinase domain-containing protein [Streptomyces antibioticus]|uniref:serine/threonine-protein kinase n=1 Tax=Streptomyces antibioticus TaxID=1890 RepID=UPI003F48759D
MAGRYRLVESIGQGGMGRVWRASDEMLDRPVAVKEMRIDGLDPEDTRTRRERALREARATARIDHPQVVRVYDVVDAGERLWIVMELVAGRSLERVLVEDGRLGPRETARIGLGLVAALRQVHARGVLHRDIKPGNVLVEEPGESGDGRVVLTDFGIAAIQDAKALTMVGMLVGSPDYMAPERIAGRPQGPPSDNWSLGATLCAALAGHSPFSRDTTLATLHAVLYDEPVLPPEAGPLHPILTALLEKEPTLRASLSEVETALRPVAYPPPTPTWPNTTPPTDPRLTPGRTPTPHASAPDSAGTIPAAEAGPPPGASDPDPRASRGSTTPPTPEARPHAPSEPEAPGGAATRSAGQGAPEPGANVGGTIPAAEAGPPPPGMVPGAGVGAGVADPRGSGGSLAPPVRDGVPAAEAGPRPPGSAPAAGVDADGSGGPVILPAAEGRSRAGSGPASPGRVPGGSGGSLAPPAPEGVPAVEAGQTGDSAPGADVGAVGSGGSVTPPAAEARRRVRDGSGPASPGSVPGVGDAVPGGSLAPPAREGAPPPPGPVGAGPRTSGRPLTPPVRPDEPSPLGLPPGTGPHSSESSPDQPARGFGAGAVTPPVPEARSRVDSGPASGPPGGTAPRNSGGPLTPSVRRDGSSPLGLPPGAGVGVGGPEAANPSVPEARSHGDSGPGAATRDSHSPSGREGAPGPASGIGGRGRPAPISLARAAAETERRLVPGGGSVTPADRTRRRSVVAAAIGVVAVGAVVAGVLVFVPGGEGGEASDTPRPGTGTGVVTTSAAPTVQGTSRPRSLPPGARVEAGGFAWVTPRGWQRDVKTGAEVHYTSPDGTQELVAKSSLARGDLMDTWETSEHNARQGQDYVKIRLEETTFRGRPAVVWEYTFTLRGTPWHARLLGFDERGKSYQINTWYQPGVEGDALRTYERVKDGFTVL